MSSFEKPSVPQDQDQDTIIGRVQTLLAKEGWGGNDTAGALPPELQPEKNLHKIVNPKIETEPPQWAIKEVEQKLPPKTM